MASANTAGKHEPLFNKSSHAVSQATPTPQAPKDPLAQARQIKVVLRSDLQVSRQVYQGSPVYVLHDPVSFRSHRLNIFQYRILSALNPTATLGQNFQTLVDKQEFDADEETVFFDLLTSFSRLGLIIMPQQNGAKLYEQHLKMKSARRRGKALGFLFMQIPLVKPDAFLTRTVGRVSWIFTKTFFVFWLLGMAAAGFVIISRFSDLVQPLNGILATKNLPFLWASFVGLKIWHELGHGYACKVFGGFVPEMGTILIAGTPAAYVDASTAWGFPERYKRLVVMCGGMFFESLVFIPGVFIWAFSSSPMLASCAYQLVIMASLVTLLFNANPLMKFDGYFIMSELIGIQNLRPKADAQIKSMLTSTFVGIPSRPNDDSLTTKALLILYGISATIYKFFLVISIAIMVAIKFPLVGLSLAIFHVTTSVGSGVLKMAAYLLRSKETEPKRGRARLVAAFVLIGLPLLACVVPVPFGVVTQGLIGAETEHYVNVDSPGAFAGGMVQSGDAVVAKEPLVHLTNDRLKEQLQVAEESLKVAKLRWQIMQNENPAAAAHQKPEVTELQQEVAEMSRRVQRLTVSAPNAGQVVQLLPETNRGRFLNEGTPLAVIVDGRPVLRTWVNEEQLGSIQRQPGQEVSFRIPGRSMSTYRGRIVSVEPAAESVFRHIALTYVGGGDILVDPATGQPLEPVFQIDIEPADDILKLTEHGARVNLRLPRRYESVAAWTVRKCVRFVQQLLLA